MTWAASFAICFSVLTISIMVFLVLVYLKELAREKEIVKQLADEKSSDANLPILYLLAAPEPAKQPANPTTDPTKPDKKDIN